MNKCKRDKEGKCSENNQRNCELFEAEPEAPDASSLEKTTVDKLANGEQAWFPGTRTFHLNDGGRYVNVAPKTRDPVWIDPEAPCYRRAPAKIRADQVPDGRKFRRDNGDIHRRVVCPRDDKGSICGVSLTPNADLKMWIDPVELVTLLPE